MLDSSNNILPPESEGIERGGREKPSGRDQNAVEEAQKADVLAYPNDAFGNEEHAEVKYKVLKWWYDIPF